VIRLRCPTSMRTGLMPKVSRRNIDGRGGRGFFVSGRNYADYGFTVRRLDYPFRSDRGPEDFL